NQAAAGIMVTASHNPGEYNGFKMIRENSKPVGAGTGIEEVERIYHKGNFPESEKKGKLSIKENILDEYVKYIRNKVDLEALKPLTVVMDAGNGMAGYVAPKMFANTPLEVVELFFELDGSFPNHEAN